MPRSDGLNGVQTPTPYSPPLEAAVIPDTDALLKPRSAICLAE